MRAHAKAHLTEVKVIIGKGKPRIFLVPNENVKEVSTRVREVMDAAQDGSDFVPAEKIFPNLADPEKRPGVALRVARLRAEMTQVELAEKIGCEQGDISKMESGRIPIGKARAKKLGGALKINYRVFL
jgi:ribosome-binding protein aMBF1 (putative translation factor)